MVALFPFCLSEGKLSRTVRAKSHFNDVPEMESIESSGLVYPCLFIADRRDHEYHIYSIDHFANANLC